MEITTALSHYVEYQQYFRNLSRDSIRRTRQEVGRLSLWTQTTTLLEISEQTVRQFLLQGVIDRKWKTTTLRTKRATLITFFKWCVAKEYIGSNPMNGIPQPKLEKRIPPKLSLDQAQRLLEGAYYIAYKWDFLRYRNRAMLAVCLYAGLRKMEMMRLHVTDVDFISLSIFVRCGKGNKDRIVPISPTLASLLQEYIQQRKLLKPLVDELFCDATGKRKVDYNSFRHHLRKIAAWSKVPFTLHKLRHTFATLMLDGGCDLYSLSKLLGHSKIETTIPYLTASVEHLRSQIMKHPLN